MANALSLSLFFLRQTQRFWALQLSAWFLCGLPKVIKNVGQGVSLKRCVKCVAETGSLPWSLLQPSTRLEDPELYESFLKNLWSISLEVNVDIIKIDIYYTFHSLKKCLGGSVKRRVSSLNYRGILRRQKSGICMSGLLLLQNRSYCSLALYIANLSVEKQK